jgi:hypothetical protein
VREIVEGVCRFSLESGPNIFESEGHDAIGKGSPRSCEFGFVLIHMEELDLVVAGESFHEGEDFMIDVGIDDFIDEGGRKVVFGISLFEVMIVCANLNGAMFFFDRNRIGNLGSVCNGVYEASCM